MEVNLETVRVVIESCGSQVLNYFIEPGKQFSRIPRIDERESQTGLPSTAVKSHLSVTRLLSIDPCTRVHDVGQRAPVSRLGSSGGML